jgi:hypothetical protein
MRFAAVTSALQTMRISMVFLGVLGAAMGGTACTTAPETVEGADPSIGAPHASSGKHVAKEGRTAKQRQAFSSWETSGGGSDGAFCYLYDETVVEEGWDYVADTAEEAEEIAVSEAESLNVGKCMELKPRLCNLSYSHETTSSKCVPYWNGGRQRYKCTVTVSTDCNFTIL